MEDDKIDTPAPDPTPEPPTHSDTLTETVNRLDGTVSELVETVKGLVDSEPGEHEQDTTPTRVPWTHRKFS